MTDHTESNELDLPTQTINAQARIAELERERDAARADATLYRDRLAAVATEREQLEAALAAEQEKHERTRKMNKCCPYFGSEPACDCTSCRLRKAEAALARADALVRSVVEAMTACVEAKVHVLSVPQVVLWREALAAHLRDREGGVTNTPKEWECVCGHHYEAHRPDNHCQLCDCRGYVDGPASAEQKGGR